MSASWSGRQARGMMTADGHVADVEAGTQTFVELSNNRPFSRNEASGWILVESDHNEWGELFWRLKLSTSMGESHNCDK